VLKALNRNSIDLIFLEIDLPFLNGFELIKSLNPGTQVILVSNNPAYAVEAYDFGIIDYLLKPLTQERLICSVNRAVKNYKQAEGLLADSPFLVVRSDKQDKKIVLPNLQWIEALGDYVKMVTDKENTLVLTTMNRLSKSLPKDKFLRIHRSYIVNLEKIDKFSSTSVEVAGMKLPMSRKQSAVLEHLLMPTM
jgi:DNA-binding LytR/AlgR family response regulator